MGDKPIVMTPANKKNSTEVKAMNDNQFLGYKHTYIGDLYAELEANAAFDAAIKTFDTTHSQPLSAADIITRNAIFTTYGRTPPE